MFFFFCHNGNLLSSFFSPPELLQQHVCKVDEDEEDEEEDLPELQLCNQERNSSVDQEDPEPPQVEEEQEGGKQEIGSFMLAPTCEKSDPSEDQTLLSSPDETQSATKKEPVSVISIQSSVVSQPNNHLRLLSHNSYAAESQDHTRDNHGTSPGDPEPKPTKNHSRDAKLKLQPNPRTD